MKQAIIFLLVLILAILLGLFIAHVPAFLLLQIGSTSIAAPLWLLTVVLFVLVSLYVLTRKVVRRVWMIPKKLRDNLAVMHQRQSMRKKIQQVKANIERVRTKR